MRVLKQSVSFIGLALALGVGCASGSASKQGEVAPSVDDMPEVVEAAPAAKVGPTEPLPLGPLPAEADKRVAIDKSTLIYDDGDSFAIGDEEIRVLGIDTPEITHHDHGIHRDQPYGQEAAAFTKNVLENAELVEYLPTGKDPYGRSLSHIFVDGELLSVKVIRAGFAVENISRYGDNGTPEIAGYILTAAQGLPDVPFQDPHHWRKENRKR